jgi:methionyl aminopeptidase
MPPKGTLVRKSRHDIKLMRIAGQIVGEALLTCVAAIKPGMSTLEIDSIAEAYIRNANAIPTFKGYYDFPATLCISVNDEIVHGIPKADKILKEGDIVSLDCGATYKGLVADSAVTVPVGVVEEAILKLLADTKAGLFAGINQMRVGNYLEAISGAVEDVCVANGYGLVKQYGGHGVGHKLHEEPFVHNYRTGVKGPMLIEGVALAIEPMYNLGTEEVYTAADQWTVLTVDHLPSAHFEHTVVVTDGDPDILTLIK